MSNDPKLNIDVVFVPSEDRLRLSLRLGEERTDWWFTRRMVTELVSRWVQKMKEVGLPQIKVAGLASMQRDLSQEHAMSLEFDGPASSSSAPSPAQLTLLATEVNLSVSESECNIIFKNGKAHSQLKLTRKEAHAFLEMLANKAKSAGWLQSPLWPEWLGGSL
jgi:hypothetical protein